MFDWFVAPEFAEAFSEDYEQYEKDMAELMAEEEPPTDEELDRMAEYFGQA